MEQLHRQLRDVLAARREAVEQGDQVRLLEETARAERCVEAILNAVGQRLRRLRDEQGDPGEWKTPETEDAQAALNRARARVLEGGTAEAARKFRDAVSDYEAVVATAVRRAASRARPPWVRW